MSSNHTSPSGNDELEFVDISIEQFREYVLASGDVYQIENPIALFVREESGNHRVLSKREDGQYVSHHVPGDGRRPIEWIVEPGEPFFLGWGQKSVDETPAPLVQPRPNEATGRWTIRKDLGRMEAIGSENGASIGDTGTEIRVLGDHWGDCGTYADENVADKLRTALDNFGGEAMIATTAQGFVLKAK